MPEKPKSIFEQQQERDRERPLTYGDYIHLLESTSGAYQRARAKLRQPAGTAHENQKAEDTPINQPPKEKELGVERAMLVEIIRGEMVELSQALELAEDYDSRIGTNEAFANFKTVSVCNRHQDLREKLCAIKTTTKPKIVEIACEIAARFGGNGAEKRILPSTFKDAHKRHGAAARQRLKNRK